MLKMRRHFSGGCKKSLLIVLTVLLFTVIFTACEKENEPEDNSHNNSATVSETSTFENTADNSQLNTTLPQYAFEEEEQVQHTENGTANTTVPDAKNEPANTTASSGSSNYETENSTVAMPPKADSQQGEWGASVIN